MPIASRNLRVHATAHQIDSFDAATDRSDRTATTAPFNWPSPTTVTQISNSTQNICGTEDPEISLALSRLLFTLQDSVPNLKLLKNTTKKAASLCFKLTLSYGHTTIFDLT